MKPTDFINTEIKENLDQAEYNDEAGMVKNNLHTIVRVSTQLEQALGDNENVPEWVQEKIAQTKGMIVGVMEYMVSQHEQGIKPEMPSITAESIEEKYAGLLGEMTTAGIATAPSVGTGPQVGSLFGGNYSSKTPFSKKKPAKKESMIKR